MAAGSPLDPFLADADEAKRHEIVVRAPAGLTLEVAKDFDLQSVPAVHAIFWLRHRLLRARGEPPARGMGLAEATRSYGWGVLLDGPHAYVSGAACRPWEADVVFRAIPAERFAEFAEPGMVKIAWSLEVEPLGPARTRLVTETRAAATDAAARVRFRRYWRLFGIGILMIRLLMLPAVRRRAERRWEESSR